MRLLKGGIIKHVIKALDHLNNASRNTLINHTLIIAGDEIKGSESEKIKKVYKCIYICTVRGYITFNKELSRKQKKDIYKLDSRVKLVDGKYYFEK